VSPDEREEMLVSEESGPKKKRRRRRSSKPRGEGAAPAPEGGDEGQS
jgi:hypothetical protein